MSDHTADASKMVEQVHCGWCGTIANFGYCPKDGCPNNMLWADQQAAILERRRKDFEDGYRKGWFFGVGTNGEVDVSRAEIDAAFDRHLASEAKERGEDGK